MKETTSGPELRKRFLGTRNTTSYDKSSVLDPLFTQMIMTLHDEGSEESPVSISIYIHIHKYRYVCMNLYLKTQKKRNRDKDRIRKYFYED